MAEILGIATAIVCGVGTLIGCCNCFENASSEAIQDKERSRYVNVSNNGNERRHAEPQPVKIVIVDLSNENEAKCSTITNTGNVPVKPPRTKNKHKKKSKESLTMSTSNSHCVTSCNCDRSANQSRLRESSGERIDSFLEKGVDQGLKITRYFSNSSLVNEESPDILMLLAKDLPRCRSFYQLDCSLANQSVSEETDYLNLPKQQQKTRRDVLLTSTKIASKNEDNILPQVSKICKCMNSLFNRFLAKFRKTK